MIMEIEDKKTRSRGSKSEDILITVDHIREILIASDWELWVIWSRQSLKIFLLPVIKIGGTLIASDRGLRGSYRQRIMTNREWRQFNATNEDEKKGEIDFWTKQMSTLYRSRRKNLMLMRVIDDQGCFAIADRYRLRHCSAESAIDIEVIKFGILVVLHLNPGCHNRFSDGAGKCKKTGSDRMYKSQFTLIIPWRMSRELFSIAVQIAIGANDALRKMWPAPDLSGAAYWKWEEHGSIPTTPVDDDTQRHDKLAPTPRTTR